MTRHHDFDAKDVELTKEARRRNAKRFVAEKRYGWRKNTTGGVCHYSVRNPHEWQKGALCHVVDEHMNDDGSYTMFVTIV